MAQGFGGGGHDGRAQGDALPVIVAGAGPCGLGLAAALARRGLRVQVVDPAPDRRWVPRYGLWCDEARALGIEDALLQVWGDTGVRCAEAADAPLRSLGRGYALLDNDSLQERWRREVRAAGGEVTAAKVIGVRASPGPVDVVLQAGGGEVREVRARVVVDATGHRSRLTPRSVEGEAAQTALGWTLRWPDHPWEPGRAILMDWSVPGTGRTSAVGSAGSAEGSAGSAEGSAGSAEGSAGSAEGSAGPWAADLPPSFLYVLPLDAEQVFVEETVLASRPAVERGTLEARLRARLRGLGLAEPDVLDEEWCWIPMGAGPVVGAPGVVPFGGAAGLVHPASGYLVARALRVAEEVSEPAYWRGDEVSRSALASRIWSGERARRQALYRFGLETLLGMDARRTRDFFARFFALPSEQWRAYLGDAGSASAVRATMWSLFVDAPGPLRWLLLRAGLGAKGWAMVREGGLGGE